MGEVSQSEPTGQNTYKLIDMENNLLSKLRRHDLLLPLVRRGIVEEAVANVKVPPETLEEMRRAFFLKHKLEEGEPIEAFMRLKGISREDLEWQIALPHRIDIHCERQFRHKAEAQFLKRKNELDEIVYSLLRTKDQLLARELYLRIQGGEANFSDLAAAYSEGPEKNTKGIVGPVPLMQAHPLLAEKMRTTTSGVLMHPIRINEWWLVARLESYRPATFDSATATGLCRELFNKWVNDESARRIADTYSLEVEQIDE